VSVTVLIAPAEHLGGLQEQRGLKGARTFVDTEAHLALDVIRSDRPQIIALEKEFAASRRGVALLNRIKGDPALASTEVRIVYSRRAPRFKVVAEMQVIIDGNPAQVIDLSMIGAQVLSSSSLRPNQRVRMSLEDHGLRFNAAVAWATFELPTEGPRYRAGISFHDANSDVLTRLLEAMTASNHV
jgi:hypothetical protein